MTKLLENACKITGIASQTHLQKIITKQLNLTILFSNFLKTKSEKDHTCPLEGLLQVPSPTCHKIHPVPLCLQKRLFHSFLWVSFLSIQDAVDKTIGTKISTACYPWRIYPLLSIHNSTL